MSKSLGNSPDPLDLIEKYGADGVRVGMLLCSPAGGDILYDDSLPAQGTNFTAKIWNSFRLVKGWSVDNNIEQPEDIIVTGRKESYAKDKGTGTPNILIDDRPVNIQKWQAAGGYGILYQANRDSLDKVKKGLEEYGKVQRDQ